MYGYRYVQICVHTVLSYPNIVIWTYVCVKVTLLRMYIWNKFCLDIDVVTPTNVASTVLTSRSISITWDPSSSCCITEYIISYTTTVSYASGGSVRVNGASTSSILTNLEENTLYTITVQAIVNNTVSYSNSGVQATTYTDGKY